MGRESPVLLIDRGETMKKTTEFQLLRLFNDRMTPHHGSRLSAGELQALVKANGSDIIKALQQNHGHDLSMSVSFLRDILNQLDIKPHQQVSRQEAA